jgi:hypothetical protein
MTESSMPKKEKEKKKYVIDIDRPDQPSEKKDFC